MTSNLHILLDGAFDGPTNMGRDEALLYGSELLPAVVRIYGWDPPTLSLGYFQEFDRIHTLPDDVRNLAIVRRPTGGGAILHDREITYCLALDDRLPPAKQAPAALYEIVHTCWRDTLADAGIESRLAPDEMPLPTPRTGPFFCFQKPGRTDLIIGDDKLLGSAQRRIPGRVLQHGSLLLQNRFKTHPGVDLGGRSAEVSRAWVAAFVTRLARELNLRERLAEWTPSLLADAQLRRGKYAGDEWTRKR